MYKLLYFSPLSEDIDWYFMMAVDNVAFTERSNAFASLSVAVLVLVMLVAIVLLLALTVSHYRTVQANDRARSQGEFLSNMSHADPHALKRPHRPQPPDHDPHRRPRPARAGQGLAQQIARHGELSAGAGERHP